MKTIRMLTRKEWALGLLLYIYIGGFAYFWGASADDLYLLIVVAFLATQLIGNRVTSNIILQHSWTYRVSNRYVRLMMNFAMNVLLANCLMLIIGQMHRGDMAEFLEGPVIYGLLYGLAYYLYFLLSLCEAREIKKRPDIKISEV